MLWGGYEPPRSSGRELKTLMGGSLQMEHQGWVKNITFFFDVFDLPFDVFDLYTCWRASIEC